MSGTLLRCPACLVYFALVACYAAILVQKGCDAQFLIDNGGGLGFLPPGLRLSQTLQQVCDLSISSVIPDMPIDRTV